MIQRYLLPEYIIPLNGKWQKISEEWLRELESTDKRKAAAFDDYITRYQKNPLAFFLPHGRPRKDGTNDGLALLNDYENDLILLTAPNQTGKSVHAAIYIMLRTLPCDPSWPCFTQHGLKVPQWKGPQQVIVSSYSWDEVNVVWNTYRKFMPREMMGPYSPFWGHFKGEHGRPRDLRFHHVAKSMMIACDTQFTFLSYVQSLTHWEGKQCDIAHLDEQSPEDKFDALTARQITRGGTRGHTPIIMSLTGHVVPDRPDTGAAGWIKRKIVDSNVTKGRKVAQYKIAVADVPDEIIPAEKKRIMHVQWVEEPTKHRDEKKLREAEARYWGGWEVAGGVALSEWNPLFHVIEPFDVFKYDPTLYRIIDHGQNPCAAGFFAKMPWGDLVMFDEYYEFGKNIHDNAAGIVARSGNEIRKLDWDGDEDLYEEVFTKMHFAASELDARSFARKGDDSSKTIGRMYNDYGCYCTPTTGMHDHKKDTNFSEGTIPMLKDYLSIRPNTIHIDVRLKRPRDKELILMGAPKLYVFSTCRNVRNEIERWMGTGDDNDDLISCLKYLTCRDRPYKGDFGVFDTTKTRDTSNNNANSLTGY